MHRVLTCLRRLIRRPVPATDGVRPSDSVVADGQQAVPRADLVYPIYLDVPMMAGFIAAIEGGVVLDRTVSTADVTRTEREKDRQAAAKAAVPSLLEAAGKLKERRTRVAEEAVEESTIHRETDVSLFIRLRSLLLKEKCLYRIEDFATQYDGIEQGALLELKGIFKRGPVHELVSLFSQVAPVMEADAEREGRGSGRPSRAKHTQEDQSQEGMRIVAKVATTVAQQPTEDMLMLPSGDPAAVPWAVVTANPAYAINRDLVDLLEGEFTLLGKVLRKLSEGEQIDLLRGTVFGRISDDAAEEMFSALRAIPEIKVDVPPLRVSYPALHLIPLAVFV